jgi:hypothetical protein
MQKRGEKRRQHNTQSLIFDERRLGLIDGQSQQLANRFFMAH